jgi:hypothetical protein
MTDDNARLPERLTRRLVRPLTKGIVLSALAALVLVPAATAADREPPWAGGPELVSPFEAQVSNVATQYVAAIGSPFVRPVSAVCLSPEEWDSLWRQVGEDPAAILGAVPFDTATGRPYDFTILSPLACGNVDGFLAAPDKRLQRECQTGTKTEYRTETRMKSTRVKVRRKVRGKWHSVWVKRQRKVSVQVPVTVPVYEVCKEWPVRVIAFQVLAHESTHLAGVTDEALTDCLAMQNLQPYVGMLGVPAEWAKQISDDYWVLYQNGFTPYPDPECRDGGAHDVRPEDKRWPSYHATLPPAGVSLEQLERDLASGRAVLDEYRAQRPA